MGILRDSVLFEKAVPTLDQIVASVEARTGLHCKISHAVDDRALIRCREFRAVADICIDHHRVIFEMILNESGYFFREFRESLIDWGGCLEGHVESSTNRPAPIRWRDRKWTEQFLDMHPILAGVVIMVIGLTRAIRLRFTR